MSRRFSEHVSGLLTHQFKQPVFSLQMDSVLYAEFLLWKENPSPDHSSAFLSRIYREDVGPCLSFTRSEVTPCRDGSGGLLLRLSDLQPSVSCSCRSGCRAPWRTTR